MRNVIPTLGLLCVLATSADSAQEEEQRATVVTRDGEKIEGFFAGATAGAIEVRIAGQNISVPLKNVKYVSFVGDLGTAPATGGSTELSPLDDALAAFNEIQSATEIGLLRDQYADKLQATLPRVVKYLESVNGEDHPDVQLSFRRAAALYQYTLDLQAWPKAATYWGAARAAVDFAKGCLSEPPSYREDPSVKTINVGKNVNGRLGTGDQVMSASLDKSSAGAFNDVYEFRIDRPSEIEITVYSLEFDPHITLLNQKGENMEGDRGYGGKVTSKKRLNSTGTYKFWLGAMEPGHVGNYTVSLQVR